MNPLIERLKHNENPHRIFVDFSNEESQTMWRVGPKNCEYLSDDLHWLPVMGTDKFFYIGIYRIKPDYQPQPEYVDLEVVEYESGMWLGVYSDHHGMPHHFTHIHALPSLPGFRGFQRDGIYIGLDFVAEHMAKGEKVIARFEKE